MSDRTSLTDKDAMSCSQLLEVLQVYIDGRLDEETARKAHDHLEACKRCGLESSVYIRIKEVLRSLGPSVPDDLVRHLQEFARSLF